MTGQPVYVRLPLPQTIDGGPASDYAGVRIADAQNREVAYALDATPATSASQAVVLSDVGFVQGKFTQAIGDLGQSGALHSDLELMSSQPTFFEHVEVATSDDRQTWTVVNPDALIYRVAQNNDAGQSTIDFGASRARWVRIRVLDGSRAFPLTGARVAAQPAPPRIVPLSASVRTANVGQDTVVNLDFGTPNTNLAAVAFETTTPDFSRTVDFSGLTNATISRFAAGRPSLTADLGNQHLRTLKLTIANGNDPPLAALHVTPLGYEHHLIFAARPGESYRLLWGNPEQTPPTYDLEDRLAHEPWEVAEVARLGGTGSTAFTPAVPPPPAAPWLQQAALPIGLVLACLVLGAVALFSLRKNNPDEGGPAA